MVDISSPRRTASRRRNSHSPFQQEVEGVLVGTDILYDIMPNPQKEAEIERIRMLIRGCAENDSNTRTLSFALHNNSNQPHLKPPIERPRSAYFTFNPYSNTVTVEWGEINSVGYAKLHHYLNRVIDYSVRHRKGMIVRSGHIARLIDEPFSYALFDSLNGPGNPVTVPQPHVLHPMVDILSKNRYIVVSSDGYICVPQTVARRVPIGSYKK